MPTSHQLSPRIRIRPPLSADASRSCGSQIVLLPREHGPGDSRRLIGERDNRPIEAPPRREPFQPLGAMIVALRQSKHNCAGAMDHLTSEIVIGSSSNPAEPGFSTCRVLAGHEANPCRKLSSRAKMATVVNRCNERGCDHGTDARQLRQAPAGFVRPAKTMSCRSTCRAGDRERRVRQAGRQRAPA